MNTYRDTRGRATSKLTFTQAVVKGIAEGGGLFVPEEIPRIALDDIVALEEATYAERAARVFKLFGVDLDDTLVDELMERAYGVNFDDERVAPVEQVRPDMHVLELWHGPTSAFKDMALQCMPLFFSASIDKIRAEGGSSEDYLILVATSGDTGKAALDGFADREHTSIAVFFPTDGVSDIQRKQMVTQLGDNVAVYGVRGNFDDCQSAVKATFSDAAFNAELLEKHNVRLSSANSINWGRLLPQIVYYLSAYADMVASGGVVAGHPVDICVPTGNFGNILGAYYAKQMGMPIARLICASNENRVLADFIATGTYDISDREFVLTPSPSMDILISSNLERQLFELTGRDGDKVAGWMDDLARDRRFTVDRETFAALREHFVADFVTNDESLATIRRVFNETGYLLDPHTAVAWEVAERVGEDRPILVVSTAHWAKFGGDVYRALTGLGAASPLPDELASKSGVELNKVVQTLADGAAVPLPLAELDSLPVRFDETVDAGREGVESAVTSWLAR